MESIIKTEKQEEQKYPCLKISNIGTVVLFTNKSIGTVVNCPSVFYTVGQHSDTWNELSFKLFNGEITLKN